MTHRTEALLICVAACLMTACPSGAEPAEDFTRGVWYSLGRGGVWEVVATNEIHQTEHAEPWKNNGFNRAFDQAGTMEYEWGVRLLHGSSGGIYVLADATNGVDRGTSYLLWYAESTNGGGRAEFSLAKFIRDQRQAWAPSARLPVKRGDWVTLRVRIDTATGEFIVHCNGEEVARFVDETPIRAGNHVSLHTCVSAVAYRDLQIRRIAEAPAK